VVEREGSVLAAVVPPCEAVCRTENGHRRIQRHVAPRHCRAADILREQGVLKLSERVALQRQGLGDGRLWGLSTAALCLPLQQQGSARRSFNTGNGVEGT